MKSYKNLIVCLIVTTLIISSSSCKKTGLDSDEVKACFTYSPAAPKTGDTIVFTSCSSNATILDWDFDGVGYGDEVSEKYVFTTPGAHVVSLEVTGATGVDSISKTVNVTGITPANASGTYNGSEVCTGKVGGSYGLVVEDGVGAMKVKLVNLATGITVLANLNGYNFTIPTQADGFYEVSGYGSFTNNSINVTYTVAPPYEWNCTFNGTK